MDRHKGVHHVGQGVPDVPVVDRVAADDPVESIKKEGGDVCQSRVYF